MRFLRRVLGIAVLALSLATGLTGVERVRLFIAGDVQAAAPSPVLTALGAVALAGLGLHLSYVLLRARRAHPASVAAWAGIAGMLAVLFHLNHASYASHCRDQARPAARRCLERSTQRFNGG